MFEESDVIYENIDKNCRLVPTADDAKLLAPYIYTVEGSTFGKMFGKIHALTGRLLGVMDEKKSQTVLEIVYSLGMCSFMGDDIQDRGALRKGRPCAYRIYGIGNTCNCASYIIFLLMEKVKELEHPEAMSIFLKYYQMMLAGQGMELYWRDNFICPTEEEYYSMVDKKTSGGFLLVAKLLRLFGTIDVEVDVEEQLINIGRYAQALDDYSDLTNPNFHKKKGYCRDITEGKHTIPIIYAIKNNPEKGALIQEILMRRTDNRELVDKCLSLITESGGLEYTKNKLAEMKSDLEATELKTNTRELLDQFSVGLFKYYDA